MNKISKFFVVSLLLMVVACSQNSKIITTNDVSIIESELRNANKDTLVIFDCDDVLIYYPDTVFRVENEKILAENREQMKNKIGQKRTADLEALIRQNLRAELVDRKMPLLISKLQAREAKVLLLTARQTGSFHTIPRLEALRESEMSRFGYDFSKSWDGCNKIVFDAFLNIYKEKSRCPIFENGIIYSCKEKKGIVLTAFLKTINSKFDRIVFIDDRRENIESVRDAVDNFGSEFVGIEYTAVKDKNLPSLNQKDIQKQFDILMKENKWLSDEALRKRLERLK